MATLVALACAAWRRAAGAGERLLHSLAGEHAESAGHAGVQLHAHDPAGGLGADEVVVVGLAADHGAEAGNAGEAPRASGIARGERQLEGTGYVKHLDVVMASVGEGCAGAGEQALGEVLVEARERNGKAHGRR